jgi:hypothetical protein
MRQGPSYFMFTSIILHSIFAVYLLGSLSRVVVKACLHSTIEMLITYSFSQLTPQTPPVTTTASAWCLVLEIV